MFSHTATAQLTWTAADRGHFRRYDIQRNDGDGFVTLATLNAREDTQYVDTGLYSNVKYRYRIAHWLGSGDTEHKVYSLEASGGIHLFMESWRTDADGDSLLPTRVAVDSRGTVLVAGAGGGRVVRFDAAGHPLEPLRYTTEPLASLAAGALDGPGLAVDSQDNLYVIYNEMQEGDRPTAHWSKFSVTGELLWTRTLAGLFARHVAIDGQDNIFIESISQLQQFAPDGTRLGVQHVPAVLVASLRMWGDRFAALIEPMRLIDADWGAPRLVVYEGMDRQLADVVIGRDPFSERDTGEGLLQRPTDFAVAGDGRRVFIVNAGLNRVDVFDGTRFLTSWGRAGTGAGEFRFHGRAPVVDDTMSGTVVARDVVAGGIAYGPGGYIYIADPFNERIQRFRP